MARLLKGMRWLCIVLLASTAARADDRFAPPGQINLASDQWLEYTNADGTGLGWDLLRKVFEPAGVSVRFRIVPYSRSVGLVQRGEADAWVGSYKDEAQALYPRWNYDTDHIYALGLIGHPKPSFATIGSQRLTWVRGYDFQKYLPNVQHFNEVQRRSGILAMLQHDRADYYIDSLNEINYILKDAGDPGIYHTTPLVDLPMYLGFADNPRGRALLRLYDQRMDELVGNGQLREIFQRWKQPYPFESGKPSNSP